VADPARIVISAEDKTRAAFASVKRNFDALQASTGAIVGRFGAIGAAITAALEVASIKGAIDAGDELNKLSQKTGIAVETLSGYKVAAELSDVSTEEFAKGVKTLSVNMVAAAGGSKDQAAAFQAIGVSVKNADGSLRNIDDVLGDVAERFAGYEDGAAKAALAQDIFGKSGAALIPLLNAGRQGLIDAREEAEKLGVVFSKDLAQQAEQFNDNLTRLSLGLQGAKVQLLGGLLPTLIKLTERLVDGRKEYGSFVGAILDGINFNPFASLQQNLDTTTEKIRETRKELEKLQATQPATPEIGALSGADVTAFGAEPFAAPGPSGDSALTEDLRKQLDLLEKRERYLTKQRSRERREELLGPTDEMLTFEQLRAREREPVALQKQKVQAPVVSKATGVAPDQIALLRRQLDGRTQAIGQSLANEQDLIRFNERVVEALYRQGSISLEASFQAEDELRRRNLDEVRLAAEERIRVEQEFQRSLPKPKDAAEATRNAAQTEGSESRVQAARAQIAAAEREFQQATDLSNTQRPEQREQLKQQVAQFDAALQDLVDSGRSRAGELQEIAERTAAAERLLIAGGADRAAAEQRAKAFGALLEQQRQFSLARDEFARITDRARDAEEALLLVQQQSGTGLLESERQVFELRKQELAQLDALIERTRALAAANPRNEEVSDDLRKLQLQRQRLAATLDPTKQRLDAAADSAAGALTDGLRDAVLEGEKLSDVIANLDKKLAGIFLDEAVFKPLKDELGPLLRGAGGKGLGENIFSFLGIGNAAASPVAGQASGADAVLKSLGVTPFNGAAGVDIGSAAGASTGDFARMDRGRGGGVVDSVLNALGFGDAAAAAKAVGVSGDADGSMAGLGVAADNAARALERLALAAGGGAGGSATGGAGGGLLSAIGGFFSGSSSTPTTGDFARLDRGQGGGSTGGFLDTALTFFASFFHDGGVAGEARGGDGYAVPAIEFFERARRYHTGGIVGVPADAVPAVLQVGEELVAPGDPRHRANGGAIMPAGASAAGGVVQPAAVRLPGLAPDEVPAYLPRGMEVLTADDPRHSGNAGGASGPAALAGPLDTSGAAASATSPAQAASPLAAVDRVLGLAEPGHSDVLGQSGRLAEAIDAAGLAAPAGAQQQPRAGAFADPRLLSAAIGAAEHLTAGEEGADEAEATGRPAPLGAVWDRAVRYHSGGVAGMAADARSPLAALEERVYAETEPRRSDGEGGGRRSRPPINITYMPAPGDSRETTTQRGRELARQAQLGMRNT
jgi:hypothetical protein